MAVSLGAKRRTSSESQRPISGFHSPQSCSVFIQVKPGESEHLSQAPGHREEQSYERPTLGKRQSWPRFASGFKFCLLGANWSISANCHCHLPSLIPTLIPQGLPPRAVPHQCSAPPSQGDLGLTSSSFSAGLPHSSFLGALPRGGAG